MVVSVQREHADNVKPFATYFMPSKGCWGPLQTWGFDTYGWQHRRTENACTAVLKQYVASTRTKLRVTYPLPLSVCTVTAGAH